MTREKDESDLEILRLRKKHDALTIAHKLGFSRNHIYKTCNTIAAEDANLSGEPRARVAAAYPWWGG